MDLLLWRHAEAEDPGRGGDLARALTPRGRTQAERMAAWLLPRLPASARILASPARRAAAAWRGATGPGLVGAHPPTIGQAAALAMGVPGAEWQVKKGAVWWLSTGKGGSVRVHAVQSPDDL